MNLWSISGGSHNRTYVIFLIISIVVGLWRRKMINVSTVHYYFFLYIIIIIIIIILFFVVKKIQEKKNIGTQKE